MPLPDERKALSASSLIQRFQSQISSTEAPLLPSSSFGSPGRPRGSKPPVVAGLGARTDEVRRSLDGRPTLAELAEKTGREKQQLRDGEGGRAVWMRSAGLPVPAAKAEGGIEAEEPPLEPSIKKSEPPLQTLFTRPAVDVPAPTPSTLAPSSSSDSLSSPSGLSAREGLSCPSSPIVESGRLSVPPPQDDPSPPPTPSPPSLSPRPSSTNSSTSPSTTRKLTTPARSGSINVPTASFLAKSKPRISATSSSRTSPIASRTSPIASRTSPTAGKTPTTTRTATPTRSPVSTKSSPSFSRTSALSPPPKPRPRTSSIGSSTSTSKNPGATPRKVVPTTGTPRSRAAAAAAAREMEGEKEGEKEGEGRSKTPTSVNAVKRPHKASSLVKVPVRGAVGGARGGKVGGGKVGRGELVAGGGSRRDASEESTPSTTSEVAGVEVENKSVSATSSIAGDAVEGRQDVESSEDRHEEDLSGSHDAASEMEIPDIPSDEEVDLELLNPRATTFDGGDKVFEGFGGRPIGKIGVPVRDDGAGGLVGVGEEGGKERVEG